MDHYPDRTLDECYEALNTLQGEIKHDLEMVEMEGNDGLANTLSSLYAANQHQMTVLWYKMARLEKKIDKLLTKGSDGKTHPRF